MTMKRDVRLANQAALVPLYSGMDKKPRPLDRDVVTIGRARGCDIGLEAPDISTLHCVLYRTCEGYRVRDCGSRTGTRVNGDLPRNHVLAEGDVLQIGPFSFTVNIPPSSRPDPGKVDPGRLERSERSRRNLAQLALNLRARLHHEDGDVGETPQADLKRKAADLRSRLRQYDERLNRLEAAERDLERDRSQLKRERESHLERVQVAEGELTGRLEATDREIHARWHEFLQRCQHEEQARQKSILDWQREREETMKTKEQLAAETHALNQAETALREQRSELARMMGDLRELQASIKKQQSATVQSLTQENEELRQLLVEYEQRLSEAASPQAADASGEIETLRAENELARQLLHEKDNLVEQLRQHVEELNGHVEALNGHVEELKSQPQAKPAKQTHDLESYEAELNHERQQLEAERVKLNKEVEQLRARNAELDEATREMEMEMSKERAELARERIRLDRMRDEVRAEVERTQRDAGVREGLASVQKLREDISQKKPGGKDEGGRSGDRLRSLRNG